MPSMWRSLSAQAEDRGPSGGADSDRFGSPGTNDPFTCGAVNHRLEHPAFAGPVSDTSGLTAIAAANAFEVGSPTDRASAFFDDGVTHHRGISSLCRCTDSSHPVSAGRVCGDPV